MKLLAAVAVAFVVAAPASSAAQETDRDAKYRVLVRGGDTFQGYLRDRSAHELVMVTADGREHRIPVAEVDRFEVRARSGNHLWRGALMGAFIGASLVATGAIDAIEDRGKTSGAALALVGGATAVGAGVGVSTPRYGWTAANPRAASARGFALTFAVRF
jgi:hypothetical protein